jgi:pimeloyl-ACP methyl ester carboxylesterase
MTTSAHVHTEGADIYYDYEGAGPLLLTIAGGGGDAPRYAPISQILKNQYTVVRYDRRGNSRSATATSSKFNIAQQARDAAAIVKAMGVKNAYIFGNSGGANVGLKLAEDSPELVKGLVAHEPPALLLLPDAEKWIAFNDRVEVEFAEHGTMPAMKLFGSELVGFGAVKQGPGGGLDQSKNLEYFLAHEFHDIGRYLPDLKAIRKSGVSVIMAVGRASKEAYYVRTARIIAERLECPLVEMEGNHLAFMIDPPTFARELREMLQAFAKPKASALSA